MPEYSQVVDRRPLTLKMSGSVMLTTEFMPRHGRVLEPLWRKLADEPDAFKFDPFFLVPGQRLLLLDQERIELGARAFDILVLLVARCGNVVTSQQIFEHAWPNLFV